MNLLPVHKKIYLRTKPSLPFEIDYADPLTKGLSAFFCNGSGGLVDLVSMVRPSFDESARKAGLLGLSSDYLAEQTGFASRQNYFLAGAMTIVVILDVDALTSFSHVIAKQASSTTNGWELRLGQASTESGISTLRANTTFSSFEGGDGPLITAGTKDNFVAVCFPSGLVEDAPDFANVNGLEMTNWIDSGGSATGAQGTSDADLFLGERLDKATKLDGAITMVALFERALSFSETELLRKDPWRMIKPSLPSMYTVPSVVVAGRVMSSMAGSGGLVYRGGIVGRGGGLAG